MFIEQQINISQSATLLTFHTNVGVAHKSSVVLGGNCKCYIEYKADRLRNPCGQKNSSPNPKITAHYCILYSAHCIIQTANFTLLTAHCSLHTAHCSLHTVHCAMLTTHIKLHTAQFTLHTAHCTLHIEHCILSNAYKAVV